jgi:hypothetical protein
MNLSEHRNVGLTRSIQVINDRSRVKYSSVVILKELKNGKKIMNLTSETLHLYNFQINENCYPPFNEKYSAWMTLMRHTSCVKVVF